MENKKTKKQHKQTTTNPSLTTIKQERNGTSNTFQGLQRQYKLPF